MNQPILETSDAWLLLAIIYASSNGPGNLSQIIAAGDFINHAIFTFKEIKGGIVRLSSYGYVEDHGDLRFSATDKILVPYKDFSKKKRRVSTELEFIKKTIGANVYKFGANQLNVNADIEYEGLIDEKIKQAYDSYVKSLKGKN